MLVVQILTTIRLLRFELLASLAIALFIKILRLSYLCEVLFQNV